MPCRTASAAACRAIFLENFAAFTLQRLIHNGHPEDYDPAFSRRKDAGLDDATSADNVGGTFSVAGVSGDP